VDNLARFILWQRRIYEANKKREAKTMTYRNAVSITTIVLLILGVCGMAAGQNSSDESGTPIGVISNIFSHQAKALGKRMSIAGKERTVYAGQLFDKGGKSTPVRVIHQLHGLIRLEGFKENGGVISFDGEKSHGITSRKSDESLLEVFAADFPEGMFDSVQNGGAIRFLGRGFGPDPNTVPNYGGPRYDIYEVSSSVRCRQDQLTRLKRYFFDTNTGLLQRTQYYDRSGSSTVKVETRFSVWGSLDGSAYPARIDHYEDGQLVFTFISESIMGEASADNAIFN
jgi:hypothetical protein